MRQQLRAAEAAQFRVSAIALISLAATTLAISVMLEARRLGDFSRWNRGAAATPVLNIQRASDEAPVLSRARGKNRPGHFRHERVTKTVVRDMSDDSGDGNDDDIDALLRAGFGGSARVESVSARPAAIVPRARGEELDLLKPITIESSDSDDKWRIARGGAIAGSSDGMNWHPLNSGTNVDLLAGAAASGRVCWVVGRFGTILRTTDGEQWERISSPTAADLGAVQAFDRSTAIVVTDDGRAFATSDGGRSWHFSNQD